MREVAESSQVALGTLYRYFPSRVHLLVATMQDQLEHMHGTLRKKPPAGDTAAERVAETLMRAFRALQREPHLADAMVRALTFADRSVSPEVDQASRQTTVIILDAMAARPEPRAALRGPGHRAHLALGPDHLALRPRLHRPGQDRHRDGVPLDRPDGADREALGMASVHEGT